MAFKQKDVERFEHDWDLAVKYLTSMIENPIVSDDKMYQGLKDRVRSLESLVIDVSSYARSDKD